ELGEKADKGYVDINLLLKADKNDTVLTGTSRLPTTGNVYFGDKTLDELLDQKAGKGVKDQITLIGNRLGAVEIVIPAKADTTYVNTELGKKADTTYVNTELGKKADTTFVNTELAKKADTSYVNT